MQRRTYRPTLEQLETRAVPATYFVATAEPVELAKPWVGTDGTVAAIAGEAATKAAPARHAPASRRKLSIGQVPIMTGVPTSVTVKSFLAKATGRRTQP